MATSLTKKQKLDLGRAILDALGDVFYEPWVYPDSEPPAGFSEWSDAAIQHYLNNLAEDAASGALESLKGMRKL